MTDYNFEFRSFLLEKYCIVLKISNLIQKRLILIIPGLNAL